MSSSKETSMSRAHALTNRANLLMTTTAGDKSNAMTATAALQQAFDAFQQGADLFEQASKNIQDHGALAAVNLLIIQNRKQMKDITRRLNTLKIQQRQRQINLDKAASAVEKETQKRHQSRELGLNKRTTTTTVTTTTASIGDRKQPSPAATVLAVAAATAAAAESRTDRHTTRDPKDDTGGASSSPNTSMIDPDKRLNSRRRRVNPATATATTSMIGSSMFETGSVGQRDTMITRSPSHPIPRPLGSPISSLPNQHYQYHHHHQQPTPSSATQSPASTIRSISRSPETNKYSSSSLMGDHYRIPITGGGGGASTSASSFYEGGTGSVYTSGYGGYSGTSRSSLGSSSALGAFEVEDSVVYLAHPLGSSDPFARFWNSLETAVDRVSNPVAFASMPIDLPQVVDPIHETMGKKKHRRQRHHKDKDKDKDKDKGGANTGAGAGKGKHGACDATDKRKDRDRERVGKGKRAESLSDSSSGDSFCLISKDNLRDDSSIHSGKSSVATITSRRQSVSTLHASGHSSLASRTTVNGKTPEELALENTSLRSSLDTLSQRYQALEHELQTYKRNSEQHQEMMKSVVLGVRREAHKAIIQSQILGSMCLDGNANERERADRSGSSAARLRSPLRHTVGLHEGEKSSPLQRIRTSLTYEYADEDPFAMDNDPEDDGQDPVETTREDSVSTTQEPSDGTYDVEVLRRRLQEVEAENQGLKVENQRSRSHLQKYRDRFERMKVSSRAKKEAKLSTGGMQRPSELPTLGEEGE